MRKNNLRIIIFATLAFIWIHSMMPPDISGNESGFVVGLLELVFGKGNVSEHLVRKLAHFSEFCLLGIELSVYFGTPHTALFHGLFVAAVDETIQIFSGRGSSLIDVWIDCSGCLTGLVIVIILIAIRKKHKKSEGSVEEAQK